MKCVVYKGVPFLIPKTSEKCNCRDSSMSYWFDESIKSTLTYVEQVWHAHKQVQLKEYRVLELFAGIGVSSAFFHNVYLHKHTGIDHDADSLDAFKSLHDRATVLHGDTYKLAPPLLASKQYNYVLCEFNAITMYRSEHEYKERKLMEQVWHSEAEYVLFVDSAKTKEHLHYKRYAEFFGAPVYHSQSYIEGVSLWIHRKYKYSVIACAFDGINYSMLFKRHAPPREVILIDSRTLVDLKQYKEICCDNL